MRLQYKYIIYKIYSWSNKRPSDTPLVNVILTLAVTHFFQFMVLFIFVDRMITPLFFWDKLNKGYVWIGGAIYIITFYFLVYNKKRWAGYIEEFKDESEEDRKSGNWLVRAYLIGSVLLFFISLPILFSLGRH